MSACAQKGLYGLTLLDFEYPQGLHEPTGFAAVRTPLGVKERLHSEL